ncbi:T7SS effector LXG polymorphic toxin [Bacillus glycinifermentans]|uniref:T7SS effector LXG polymorphic toxin n=1 Tax=Bacillus glycinifermentans TaxID=1664069 RepID=A0A0T6BPY4_9BACI|nr:T7SS effector LXG polymorphic toxin [Bacillus glycinifermentans]ATH94560.1 transposase [Bacillus glycinifermentans]KRT93703.1 transposase [Bacillus glycinifermentans]MEC0486166.1 T7SS effector LXG polymorphic toxin [Bacillus glycinifermentans]
MKTLDVHALHHAIDQTLEQLKQQSDEIANLKKSVDGITSLDDALKGKGGDAIRAFYEECHTPFLRFYETFVEEYQSTLKKIKNALNSLEPNHNGFISQAFLEHDLEQGLNAADQTTKHLVSKANAAIAKVSHIVDLPDLNDNDFHEQNRKALKDINQTIEKLHTFDREQTNALKTAENDLETMQQYIKRLEKMYTGPKVEITGYQKGSILKSDEELMFNKQVTGMNGDIDNVEPSPMEIMLKKLAGQEETEVDTVAKADHSKKIDTGIRVINGKLYNVKGYKKIGTVDVTDEIGTGKNFTGGKYTLYSNGQVVREYISGGEVKYEVVRWIEKNREKNLMDTIRDSTREMVSSTGVIGELFIVKDAYRAIFGIDPDTGKDISTGDRVINGVSVIPAGKLAKVGKYVFKMIKGEKAAKKVSGIEKGAKTPSYGKQSVPKGPYREVNGFPAKVKPGAQEKHIPGTPNYKQEVANGKKKSIFYGDNKKAQELLDKYAGKGEILKNGREVVDFGQKIGKAYDMKTGKYIETTRGTIHYSKDGAHIVPAKPLEP